MVSVSFPTIKVLFKITYALWKDSNTIHIDWIKQNGKRKDVTSAFVFLADANQSFLFIICTVNSSLLEPQAQKLVKVQHGD